MNITLKKEESQELNQPVGTRGSWPLTIRAYYDEAMTQAAPIFVYQRAGLGSSLNGDSFTTVADVLGMNELPEAAPTPDCPYFRVSTVNVICRSKDHLMEFWETVKDAVHMLVDETAAANELLAQTETVTIVPR